MRHASGYQGHLAYVLGARQKGCVEDHTGCGSIAVMSVSRQVNEAVE